MINDINECKEGLKYVVEYYSQLKAIWDEPANYSRVPQYTCGAGATMNKERKDNKVHQFLMGLNTVLYGHLRSNMLMEDEITSLSHAYVLVLREECHIVVTRAKKEQSDVAMDAKTNTGNRGTEDAPPEDEQEAEPPRFTFCKKPFHTEDKCYIKQGYPSRGRGRGRCRGFGYGRGERGYQVAKAASTGEV
ncbi:uncharacterized protein LOC141617776 [Silene latifolia]|uniref:uncharacterized protein LOC141617776 n=1 Tax=Silene latifolia TaxID=37657 RepID=UPI003D782585